MYCSIEPYKNTSDTHQFSFLSEPQVSCAFVHVCVLKIKYWWCYILALFALTVIIAKYMCFTVFVFMFLKIRGLSKSATIKTTENFLNTFWGENRKNLPKTYTRRNNLLHGSRAILLQVYKNLHLSSGSITIRQCYINIDARS